MLLGGNIYAEDYFFEIEIRGIRRVRSEMAKVGRENWG